MPSIEKETLNNMQAELSYPKSFPNQKEINFLKLALADDKDFLLLWKKWKDSRDWYKIDPATSQLIPFIYLKLKKLSIEDEFTDRMRGAYKSTWAKNQFILNSTKEAIEVCHELNVPIMMLKGIPLLLEVYGDIGARSLGDADILVRPEHGNKIVNKMLDRGWHFYKDWAPEKHNQNTSIYKIIKSTELQNSKGVNLDLHYNIFASDHGMNTLSVFTLRDAHAITFRESLWKHTVSMNLGGLPATRLANEDILIHIMVHGAEGNTHRAFRWVLDSILIIEKLQIDWDILLSKIKEFRFVIEAQLAFQFIKQNFNTKIPADFLDKLSLLEITKEEKRKYYQITNTEHTNRLKILGNLPLLWYAYFKFEPEKKNLSGFLNYLKKSWGLKSFSKIFSFTFYHYKRKFETKNANLLDGAKQAMRDSFYIVTGKALSFLASFAVITIMGRFLPREIAGSYNYVMAVLAIVSIFTLPGMNNALTRAIGRGYDGSVDVMIKKRMHFGLLGSLVAIIAGILSYVYGNPTLALTFIIASLFVPLTDTFSNFAINFWQGKKRFDRSATVGAIYYIGLAILSIPIFILTKNIILIVTGVLVVQTIMGLLVYSNIKKENTKVDQESVKLGMHLTIMQAFNILAINIDKVIVWALLGPSMVAVYTFAATPVSKANQMSPIGIISLPHLSNLTFTENVKRDILKKMYWLFYISIPLTLIIIILAPFLYKIFFPLYPESAYIFQLLFISMVFSPTLILKSALVAFQKTKELYITDVGLPSFRIVLMLLLAIKFGILGLVAGVLISSFLGFVVTLGIFLQAKTTD
jgi:O-antigen/teichoic acid export membrane protein